MRESLLLTMTAKPSPVISCNEIEKGRRKKKKKKQLKLWQVVKENSLGSSQLIFSLFLFLYFAFMI